MAPPDEDDPEGLRTTLTIPAELVDRIDDLLHEGKKSGALSRNFKRNPFIIQLLRERVEQLLSGGKPQKAPVPKK